MKKITTFVVLAAIVASSAFAQLQSTKVYTLLPEEIIYHDENSLLGTFSGNSGFWLMISGPEGGKLIENSNIIPIENPEYTAIYDNMRTPLIKNGKYYHQVKDKEYGPYESAYNIFVTKNGQFGFQYQQNEKSYLNINGNIFGPYDDCMFWDIDDNGGFAYWYYINKTYTFKIGNKEFGPFDDIDSYSLRYFNSNTFAFTYMKGDLRFCNINGTEFGPYSYVVIQHFTPQGKYLVKFKSSSDNKEYVNATGKVYGPYNSVESYASTIHENGKFAFSYIDEGKLYYNFDGSIKGPFDSYYGKHVYLSNGNTAYYAPTNKQNYMVVNNISYGPYDEIDSYTLNLTESGYFAFSFKRNKMKYLMINGTEYGPYNLTHGVLTNNKGNSMFWYTSDDKQYINVNGKVLGPLESIGNCTLNEEGNYTADYWKNSKAWCNFNGTEYGPFDEAYSYYIGETPVIMGLMPGKQSYDMSFSYDYANFKIIFSKNMKHKMELSYAYDYVVINGNKVGDSPGFSGVFDESSQSFKWFSLKGRDIIMNTYKL